MTNGVQIRSESSADISAIAEVAVAAFKTLTVSNHTEQFIIAALRTANALTVSLVAEMDERVVGHIALPQEVFFALSLNGHIPQGNVEFHLGFNADGRQD